MKAMVSNNRTHTHDGYVRFFMYIYLSVSQTALVAGKFKRLNEEDDPDRGSPVHGVFHIGSYCRLVLFSF
jgi:hypothetical protein